VCHYKKNVGTTTYTLDGSCENKTGTSDSSLTLTNLKKTFTGFSYSEGFAGTSTHGTTKPSSGAVTQTTILPDGTRVIDLYYTRDTHTVTLTKGTGIASVTGNGTYEYGATVTLGATMSTGYDWSKWTKTSDGTQLSTTKAYSFTMGTSDVAYTANATVHTYSITYNLNGGDALPSNCERLEYIQTDGSSYIDTGFKPTTTSYTHIIQFGIDSSVGSSERYICGTYYNTGRSGNVALVNSKINAIYINKTSGASGTYLNIINGTKPTISTGTKHTLELNLNNGAVSYAYLDGTKISSTSSTYNTGYISSTTNLKLGTYGYAGSAAPTRIYGDTIIQNGVVIHNLIPAKCDGVLGMYDTAVSGGAFKANAGSGSFTAPTTTTMPTSYTYTVGANVTAIPTRAHSVFAGWCTDSALTDCSDTQTMGTTTSGDKTFYAKWTCEYGYSASGNSCVPNTITITWANGGHGTLPTTKPASCTYGEIFAMPAAMSATGYTFNGYTVNSRTFAGGANVTCTYDNLGKYSGSVTITGSWKNNIRTVTLNTNCPVSGEGSANQTVYQKYAVGWSTTNFGTTITKATVPTCIGYTFRGYYTAQVTALTADASTGTQIVKADGTLPANTTYTTTGTTTLYGAWAKNCTTPEHGSCSLSVSNAGAVDYTTTCVTGYTIGGNNSASPSCTANSIGTTWYQEDGTTQITVPTEAQSCTYDAGVNLPPTPTKQGYTFKGWDAMQ
jgi:uncharacterized repeat protein (TIGR02543 family)